jgi:hypothetical protein
MSEIRRQNLLQEAARHCKIQHSLELTAQFMLYTSYCNTFRLTYVAIFRAYTRRSYFLKYIDISFVEVQNKLYISELVYGLKVKVNLEQATKAQKGSRGIALSFFNLGARWGGWSTPRPGRFTPGKKPVPVLYEAGWAPGSVCPGAENLTQNGVPSPTRPARSKSLYRLSYPGPPV